MMQHLARGVLRAYLDETLTDRRRALVARHTAACRACAADLAVIGRDRAWLADQLGPAVAAAAAVPVAPLSAWRRLVATWAGGPPRRASGPARVRGQGGFRRLPLGPVVAVGAAVLVIGAFTLSPVRAAADGVLSIFRVERLQPITLEPGDLAQIGQALASGASSVDIPNLASIRVTPPGVEPLSMTVQQAAAYVPFDLKLPATPPAGYSVDGAHVQPAMAVHVQPKVAALNALLSSLGDAAQLPAAADGQDIELDVPDIASVRYVSSAGLPPITIFEGGSPTLHVPAGVDVGQVRQALLDLPFLPADVRAQIEAVSDWQQTALVPDITGVSTPTTVNGLPGVYIQGAAAGGAALAATGASGTASTGDTAPNALIWLSGEVVRAVVGDLSQAQAQAIAAGMR